jgi:hypothetical protein
MKGGTANIKNRNISLYKVYKVTRKRPSRMSIDCSPVHKSKQVQRWSLLSSWCNKADTPWDPVREIENVLPAERNHLRVQ